MSNANGIIQDKTDKIVGLIETEIKLRKQLVGTLKERLLHEQSIIEELERKI